MDVMKRGIDVQQADPKTLTETVRALNLLAQNIGLHGKFEVTFYGQGQARLDYAERHVL
jgi:NAD-dependent oxidoreductase involved in siderophore biosynthesis